MPRFTSVLPVPVTAFSHTVEKDIMMSAMETTRITGIAASSKPAFCPNTNKNAVGNILSNIANGMEKHKLSFMIFIISSITFSFLPCPIILLTIVLVVDAKDHVNTPNNPNRFRMVLLMARSRLP